MTALQMFIQIENRILLRAYSEKSIPVTSQIVQIQRLVGQFDNAETGILVQSEATGTVRLQRTHEQTPVNQQTGAIGGCQSPCLPCVDGEKTTIIRT
ncbi:hypothetical protein [Oleiagrimonas citrea]|uniref:hypothetical protein n=1 Tax=Oleiagrimonas citrea TaxID=1665687 RepID=UPI001F04C6E2|nr:hypothetical protein [Oleiagrimonas citrea]